MSADDLTLTIHGGPHQRRDCPVASPWPLGLSLPDGPLLLVADDGARRPAQIGHAANGAPTLRWIEPELEAGAVRAYRVVQGAAGGDSMRLVDAAEGVLEVCAGNRLITAYCYGAALARPYLHPLVGPGDRRVTRDATIAPGQEDAFDHPHHRSVWVAHGDVNGVDNWSEAPGHGRTVHRDFAQREAGPVYALVDAAGCWVGPSGEPLLDERRRITVYQPSADGRVLLDVDLTFTASYGPVRFADTKEAGLLAVRVAPSMQGDRGGVIANAYGALTEAETWGRPAPWCDYSGPAVAGDAAVGGVAVLDHPGNPRHPTHWHVRDYGLMAANPFGLSDYYGDLTYDGSLEVGRGRVLAMRYRMVVHAGGVVEGRVRAAYLDFAHPPRVE